jgi:hypothetical protein
LHAPRSPVMLNAIALTRAVFFRHTAPFCTGSDAGD